MTRQPRTSYCCIHTLSCFSTPGPLLGSNASSSSTHAMISALSSGRKGPNPRLYLVSAPLSSACQKISSSHYVLPTAIAVCGHPADKRKKLFLLSWSGGCLLDHDTSVSSVFRQNKWSKLLESLHVITYSDHHWSGFACPVDQKLPCQGRTSFSSGNFSRASVPPRKKKHAANAAWIMCCYPGQCLHTMNWQIYTLRPMWCNNGSTKCSTWHM